jgi:hypothetical protein
MATTMFGDQVVLATELKKKQRYWFDRARQTGGVTIVQGKVADLVLAPRQRVAVAATAVFYARTAAQFLREMITLKRSPAESAVFPWLRDLDNEEQETFLHEFVDAFARCSTTEDWRPLEELLEDWQATAEAHRNPDLIEAWCTRGQPEDYVPMVVPHGA